MIYFTATEAYRLNMDLLGCQAMSAFSNEADGVRWVVYKMTLKARVTTEPEYLLDRRSEYP